MGQEPQPQAGSRRLVEDRGRSEVDHVQPAQGREVPQRQGARRGRREVLGREDARPAASGEHHHGQPGTRLRRSRRRLEVRRSAPPQDAGRARVRVPRLGSLLADRPGRALRPDQRRPQRDRHRAVSDGRLQPERPRRVRGEQVVLEVRPAVHGRDDAEDAHRRAVAYCGAACRLDRRRNGLLRRGEVARERLEPRRPEGRDGSVPRVADDDQGRPEAMARRSRPPGRQLRDQPSGDHQHRLQRRTATTPGSFLPGTARGR